MDVENNSETQRENKPYPDEFSDFFPYACLKFGFEIGLEKVQDESVISRSDKKKMNGKSRMRIVAMAAGSMPLQKSISEMKADYAARILARYSGDILTQLTFRQCKQNMIPWEIFRIMYQIVQFYNNLYSITVNSGIDNYCLHEINKLLAASNITEVTLDGTSIPSGNYATLLENAKNLQVLSLSHCKLGDEAMVEIIKNMEAPKPAHNSLYALNVSSNKLTDQTAFQIAQMLRKNRKLSYLNLNGNRLTAHGATLILDVLTKFVLTDEEYMNYKESWFEHLRSKQDIIDKFAKNYKGLVIAKVQRKNRKNDGITADLDEKERFDKMGTEYADSQLGDFSHPYHAPVQDQDNFCCVGNNTLAYLGVAYNNITFPFVQKLLEVIQYQKMTFFNQRHKGLINIKIEGNPLPTSCQEFKDIDNILTVSLFSLSRQARKSLVGRIKRS